MASSNMSASTYPIVAQPLLDSFVPGFSLVSGLFSQYFHIDLSYYISSLILLAAIFAGLRYCGSILWDSAMEYFVSTAEIRPDDEMYNYMMAWVSSQEFSQKTCRFVAGTKTSSDLVGMDYDERHDEERDDADLELGGKYQDYWLNISNKDKIKTLYYTPSIGSYLFTVSYGPLPITHLHSRRFMVQVMTVQHCSIRTAT